MAMEQDYVGYFKELQKLMGDLGQALPGPMTGFSQLHKSACRDGALSARTKELMALAIAITVRCDGCISFHVHDALQAGASRDEVLESIGMAVLMGGGPSVVYGCKAFEALEQFLSQPH